MSKPASFRALGSALPEASAPLPDGARELAELLAVAGGELGPAAAERALGSAQALAAGYCGLLALGMATRDGERLCLRTDHIAALRDALPRARLLELAARLGDRDLDGRARAHVLAARGERERALAEFADEIARLRAQGATEQAAQCAREALVLVGDLDADREASSAPALRGGALRLALGDALRAQGRYAEARTALGEATSTAALALRAEIARLAGDREQAHALALRARIAAGDDAVSLGEAEAHAGAARFRQQVRSTRARARRTRPRRCGHRRPAGLRASEVSVLVHLHRGERERAAARARQPRSTARAARDCARPKRGSPRCRRSSRATTATCTARRAASRLRSSWPMPPANNTPPRRSCTTSACSASIVASRAGHRRAARGGASAGAAGSSSRARPRAVQPGPCRAADWRRRYRARLRRASACDGRGGGRRGDCGVCALHAGRAAAQARRSQAGRRCARRALALDAFPHAAAANVLARRAALLLAVGEHASAASASPKPRARARAHSEAAEIEPAIARCTRARARPR